MPASGGLPLGRGGTPARDYLRQRGLTESSLKGALLGWHPSSRSEAARLWGLAGGEVYLPAGIVIPCLSGGDLWRVNVRRFRQEPPYVLVRGSTSLIYRAETLTADRPAMLLESELDAALVAQEAGDVVTALATGSVTGARHLHWQLELAAAPVILVAFDADEQGDHAAHWWLESLPHARRWRPLVKDPGEMRSAGLSVREWVEDGLRTWKPRCLVAPKHSELPVPLEQAGDSPPETSSPAPSAPLEERKGSVPPDPCALCGQEAFVTTLAGTPICQACWDNAYPGGMAETCWYCRRAVEQYDATGRAWCQECCERGDLLPRSAPPLPTSAPKLPPLPVPQSLADLLLPLPPSWRHHLLVRRAAQAYHQAGRPAVRYSLYAGASPETHRDRQLFQHLGWALDAPLGPHPAALELLRQLAADGGVSLGPDQKGKKAG